MRTGDPRTNQLLLIVCRKLAGKIAIDGRIRNIRIVYQPISPAGIFVDWGTRGSNRFINLELWSSLFVWIVVIVIASVSHSRADSPPNPLVQQSLQPMFPPALASNLLRTISPRRCFLMRAPDDDERIRRIVKEYMNELDAQRNAADASRAAKSGEVIRWICVRTGKNGLTLSNKRETQSPCGGADPVRLRVVRCAPGCAKRPHDCESLGRRRGLSPVRLKIERTMYDFIDWACQVDFVNSVRAGGVNADVPAPTDLW